MLRGRIVDSIIGGNGLAMYLPVSHITKHGAFAHTINKAAKNIRRLFLVAWPKLRRKLLHKILRIVRCLGL